MNHLVRRKITTYYLLVGSPTHLKKYAQVKLDPETPILDQVVSDEENFENLGRLGLSSEVYQLSVSGRQTKLMERYLFFLLVILFLATAATALRVLRLHSMMFQVFFRRAEHLEGMNLIPSNNYDSGIKCPNFSLVDISSSNMALSRKYII